MALAYSVAIRNARLDAVATAVGGSGLLRFYDSARPATGGTATTLLAELTCNATFAPSASGGTLTLNAITSDSAANATGTATWFRVVTFGGTFCIDGNVGTSGSDLNMNTTSFVLNAAVAVTSFVITGGNA
jgi:hypothetical protein